MIYFTVISYKYFEQAKILVNTFREYNQEPFIVFVIDNERYSELQIENTKVIYYPEKFTSLQNSILEKSINNLEYAKINVWKLACADYLGNTPKCFIDADSFVQKHIPEFETSHEIAGTIEYKDYINAGFVYINKFNLFEDFFNKLIGKYLEQDYYNTLDKEILPREFCICGTNAIIYSLLKKDYFSVVHMQNSVLFNHPGAYIRKYLPNYIELANKYKCYNLLKRMESL